MNSSRRKDVVVVFCGDSGGMSHYAHNLARALDPLIPAAIYKIGSGAGMIDTSLVARALCRIPLADRIRRHYNPLRYRRIAREIINAYQPRLVHFASGVPFLRTLVREFHKRGIAVVQTIHDPSPHEERRTAWGHLHTFLTYRYLLPAGLRECDALHVHSETHLQFLRNRYPQIAGRRCYVVQHGAGLTSEIQAGVMSPPELSHGMPSAGTALFFGRIQPYKGLPLLLEATRVLVARDPSFRLIIGGAGTMPPLPPDIVDRVTIINRFIRDEEMQVIFRSASFVVLPYLSATQTGVTAIAAAFSLPAIVTRVGSLPDLIVDRVTGLICPPHDVDCLVAAMETLLQNPGRTREMGQEAKLHMLRNYGWPLIGQRHARHYAALLGTEASAS